MGNSDARCIERWECHCSDPPVLLATFDRQGGIYISIRKRHYHIQGPVSATCPRCGAVYRRDWRGGTGEK